MCVCLVLMLFGAVWVEFVVGSGYCVLMYIAWVGFVVGYVVLFVVAVCYCCRCWVLCGIGLFRWCCVACCVV